MLIVIALRALLEAVIASLRRASLEAVVTALPDRSALLLRNIVTSDVSYATATGSVINERAPATSDVKIVS